MYRVGIDLGGTNIVAGVVNDRHEIVAFAKCKTACPRPSEEIVADMARMTREAVKKAGITMDEVKGVGVGSPGVCNKDTGVVERAANLGFENLPICAMLAEMLGKKVYIENDANAAALGEFIAGAAKDVESCVCITLGTGVGGGTLKGLAVKVLGERDMRRFDHMAMDGDCGRVDLLIGDFVESYGILDPEITASNLARLDPMATDADWAAGLANLVLQVIGTMSLLACSSSGAESVAVIGAMADTEPSRANFAKFQRVYGRDFLIPEHSACATAIGAARRAMCV